MLADKCFIACFVNVFINKYFMPTYTWLVTITNMLEMLCRCSMMQIIHNSWQLAELPNYTLLFTLVVFKKAHMNMSYLQHNSNSFCYNINLKRQTLKIYKFKVYAKLNRNYVQNALSHMKYVTINLKMTAYEVT